jgi:hypothetical protein
MENRMAEHDNPLLEAASPFQEPPEPAASPTQAVTPAPISASAALSNPGAALGGLPFASASQGPQQGANPTLVDKDMSEGQLAALKQLSSGAAGQHGFMHGAWNGGEAQGKALKTMASTGVNVAFSAAKIATAGSPEEREKAIQELGKDAAGGVASLAHPVAGEVAKGLVDLATAKTPEEREAALKNAGFGMAGEAAGAIGGPVAKAAAHAVGGMVEVFSKPADSMERAGAGQTALKRLAGNIPLAGAWLGKKVDGVNTSWAERNRGIFNSGDGTYTMPNGTIYDPAKGPPKEEHRTGTPTRAQDEAEREQARRIQVD